MRKILVLIACLLLSGMCFGKKVPKHIRDRFTNCYNGENTDIRRLLEIDGYYAMKVVYKIPSSINKGKVDIDTFEVNLLFYEDGSVLYNFFDTGSLYPGKILGYLERVTKGLASNSFYEGFYWGIYRLSGDAIIVQLMNNPDYLAPWMAWEYRFVVTGRESFFVSKMETRKLERTNKNKEVTLSNALNEQEFLPAVFHPSPYIPPSNSWLKKQPWTWCENRKEK